jgi:hypothetical protein
MASGLFARATREVNLLRSGVGGVLGGNALKGTTTPPLVKVISCSRPEAPHAEL